jgi:O-glycosyl hydrolase
MKKRFFALSSAFLILSIAISVTLAGKITVNTESLHQTMSGFGGAGVFFENWLTTHQNKEEIYDLIFKNLNPDILRIRNSCDYDDSAVSYNQEMVEKAGEYLGHPIDFFISSWSPPAYPKKAGVLKGGTLLQVGGKFVYDEFSQSWYDYLVAYAKIGILPTYISMRNEPDYENTGWEICIFDYDGSRDYPDYKTALSKLQDKLKDYPEKPLIPAPEVTGMGADNFQNYNYVDTLDRSIFDIYAYHLYNGGQRCDPGSFNTNLEAVKINYADKPDIITEYSHDGWSGTALIIQMGKIVERS